MYAGRRLGETDCTVYNRFKDYDRVFRITSSRIIFPPEIYSEIVKNVRGRVFDIGTGDGYKLENILDGCSMDEVESVIAIDPSPLHTMADKRLKRFRKVEVYNLAVEDFKTEEKFDTILMFEVIEHLFQLRKTLSMVATLLKDDGVFICSTPNKWLYSATERLIGKRPDETHVNEMNYRQFISLMKSFFLRTRFMGVLPFMKIGRRFPGLLSLNRYLSFIPISRTIYCFAEEPRANI